MYAETRSCFSSLLESNLAEADKYSDASPIKFVPGKNKPKSTK